MKRILIASALILSPMTLAATAQAQGTIPGAQRGAAEGNRAAGPIGGVVGGAVGAATEPWAAFSVSIRSATVARSGWSVARSAARCSGAKTSADADAVRLRKTRHRQ